MEAAAEEAEPPMDLTEELDPFVLDYLLERGWLTGRDLCRVGQVKRKPLSFRPFWPASGPEPYPS